MPSTFLGLNTAYTGLTAANAALNTTANNISNVNTDGYSRQIVKQQATNAMRTYTTYGCLGAGVDTIAIDRQRDAFYDFKFWNNNADLGEYEVLQNYMKQIEDHFLDDKTTKGFSSIFNEMYESLQEVAKNASDSTTKSQFIGYSQNLAYYFNTMAKTLENLQLDANSEIKNTCDQINTYAAEIASLNKQINVVELTGVTANELRDKRDYIIDKLSLLVDVSCTETPVYDTNDPTRETGASRYTVLIAGGQKLVDANDYYTLECTARGTTESINQSDATGLYDISWSDGRGFNMYNASMGGHIQGLIKIRDGNNTENFKGTLASTTADSLTIDVTNAYLLDLNKCTLAERGRVIADSKTFYYDSFSVNYDAAGNISSYTFHLDSTKTNIPTSSARIGQGACTGYSIDYQGIPYYQEQLNEWCRNFSNVFNNILTQAGSIDNYGDAAKDFFVANDNVDNAQKYLDETSTNVNDTYYYMTASNFAVSQSIIDDSQRFATHTGEASNVSAYDVVRDLIDLRTNKDRMEFRGCSSSEFLQCIMSDVALNASNANTFTTTFTNISTTIDNQRQSISGVDTDEEALNLVAYQHAYNLASQMIQTLTEVYDRLILQTGV